MNLNSSSQRINPIAISPPTMSTRLLRLRVSLRRSGPPSAPLHSASLFTVVAALRSPLHLALWCFASPSLRAVVLAPPLPPSRLCDCVTASFLRSLLRLSLWRFASPSSLNLSARLRYAGDAAATSLSLSYVYMALVDKMLTAYLTALLY